MMSNIRLRQPLLHLRSIPRGSSFQISSHPANGARNFEALLALAEFARTNWLANVNISLPPTPGSGEEQNELQQLVFYQANNRANALNEIIAQNQNFQSYIVAHMMIGRRSHNRTYLLMKIAARAGELVMATLKMYFNRARPSQVYPPLSPPLNVADHASYPSGHSLVAHLMAFTGGKLVPAMATSLADLAHRIAINREYAGFHFPSDTRAGREAAAQTLAVLEQTRWFQQVLRSARREW